MFITKFNNDGSYSWTKTIGGSGMQTGFSITTDIDNNVFVNFTGNVLEVNYEKGRLSVMVSIFGRDTRVDDLEFWQVEKVTSE